MSILLVPKIVSPYAICFAVAENLIHAAQPLGNYVAFDMASLEEARPGLVPPAG